MPWLPGPPRGRARTLTGIAPAGGWHRWSPVKYEIVGKFVAGLPVWLTAVLLGKRIAHHMPVRLVRTIAAAIFAMLGIATLLGVGKGMGF